VIPGRLSGKVCVITGTGGSMGRETALAFAREGGRSSAATWRPYRSLAVSYLFASQFEKGNLMQPGNVKSVGIIGAGRIGQAMAQIALRAGRRVVIANSRGPQSLSSLVEELGEGVTAGTVKDAAAADIVVLAVMWPDVPQAVEGLEWKRRFVIDPTNDFDPSNLDGRTSSEVVADLVAPAPVVKAANTLAAAVLGSDPHEAGGQRVIFLSGDDTEAKSEVVALFEDAGFFVVDLGGLREGGRMQQVGASLAGHNLVRLP
jgi:predicted dinucleotide-binding enzyme